MRQVVGHVSNVTLPSWAGAANSHTLLVLENSQPTKFVYFSLEHAMSFVMSLANPPPGPRAAQTSSSAVASPATSLEISRKTDLFISLCLYSWPALTLAIQNHWGGPSSTDKRDWFAGAVSDLLSSNQLADSEDLEEVLLQVMLDEFEVVVDDDSPMEIAIKIMKGQQRIRQGDFEEVDQMYTSWQEKQTKGAVDQVLFEKVEEDEDGQDTDWSDEQGEDEDGDEQMSEAPQLVEKSKREKRAPEVDEEGFTRVMGRRKRP